QASIRECCSLDQSSSHRSPGDQGGGNSREHRERSDKVTGPERAGMAACNSRLPPPIPPELPAKRPKGDSRPVYRTDRPVKDEPPSRSTQAVIELVVRVPFEGLVEGTDIQQRLT